VIYPGCDIGCDTHVDEYGQMENNICQMKNPCLLKAGIQSVKADIFW
jgi:hypothetical protein